MVIALARTLQQSVCSSNVAISHSFCHEEYTTLRFHLEPIATVSHNSFQGIQALSFNCNMAAIMKPKTGSPLAREYYTTAFSRTSRSSNPQRTSKAKLWKPFLKMATRCLPAKREESPTYQEGGNYFAPTFERKARAGEDSFRGSCTDKITLDKWLRDAVFEIVRNIQEAPFIHLIFDSQNIFQRPPRQKVPREFYNSPDLWTAMRDSIMESSPVGLILVEKLNHPCLTDFHLAEQKQPIFLDSFHSDGKQNGDRSSTDIWGLLVEGKSIASNSCYILKTTRVESITGTCTHFCLTKAKCCGPSIQVQLENIWLL